MHTLDEILAKYPPIQKKGIVSYSSKFFAASTIATLATLSYCITDGIIYGFKFNRHLSMSMLFSAAFVATSLMLVISYGVFKYSNKRSDSLKEAVKISNRKIASISGKVFAAALAISVTSLACTLITSAINGQDSPFLSLVRETFGFSSNGAWIGGSGGLLLCFLASSFIIFAISGLMHLYSKDKDVSWDSRFRDTSQRIFQENAACRDSDSSISSDLSAAATEDNGNKKNITKTLQNKPGCQNFDPEKLDFSKINELTDEELKIALEHHDSTKTTCNNPDELDRDKTIKKIIARAQVKGSHNNIDSALQEISNTFEKFSNECEQEAKSLQQEKRKPTPLPRKSLPEQANNNTDLSDQESALLEEQGKVTQERRGKNSSHPGEKIPTLAERTESLRQNGLNI